MSTESMIQTIAVSPDEMPAAFANEDKVFAFFNRFHADFPDKDERHLSGWSRNYWFTWAVSRILNARQLESLRFLSGQASALKFPPGEDESDLLVTIFAGEQLDPVIAELDSVLEWLRQSPEKIPDILADEGYSAENLLEIFNTSEPCGAPNEQGDEDGDGPAYLFICLKMLRRILGYAKRHRMCVVHALYPPGGAEAPETPDEIEAKRRKAFEAWRQQMGGEIGPAICRTPGCRRLRIKNSAKCLAHHYEMTLRKPWPFGDY